MRKIAEFVDKNTGSRSKVYRNTEWNEYVVKWYDHKGKHMDASDYFTWDKQDAIDTASLGDDLVSEIKIGNGSENFDQG